MANIARQSSKRVSNCFRRPPVPNAMMPTNRKRKVVEPSSYKPQLSLLRDRDKLLLPRHREPALEQGATTLPLKCRKEFLQPDSNPSCCSISSLTSGEMEKTNGCSNSANNCPMTLLKHFCPSVPFFLLRLFPWTACPCSFDTSPHRHYFLRCINQNESTNDRNKSKPFKDTARIRTSGTFYANNCSSDKIFPSMIIFLMVYVMFFAELIQVGCASPLPSSIPTPTHTTVLNQAYFGDTKNGGMTHFERLDKSRLRENEAEQNDEYRHHHQLYTINNTTFDGGGAGVDKVREMKKEMNRGDVNLEKGHSRGRILYSDSIKNDSKTHSGNLVEFTSMPVSAPHELPNSSNNKNKMEWGGKKEKELLTTMPLAVRMREGAVALSSSSSPAVVVAASTSKQQQQDASIQVTNDLFPEMKESGNKNNGDDESSFILINNNNNDNDDNSDSMSVPTTATSVLGNCWSVSLGVVETEENETEPLQYTALSSASDSIFSSTPMTAPRNPIGLVCNGTNQLAITLSQIPENLVHQVISIAVKDSLISTLNLSLFHRFPRLESISVTHSNITQIIGTCPTGLKALNVSFNNIRKLNGSIFSESGLQEGEYDYEELGADEDDDTIESNNDSDNIATNFPTEMISSYFVSSAEQLVQQQNKSRAELELLSLSPSASSSSSSSEPSIEKIPLAGRFKTDYYSKKLMGLQTRTKKFSAIPFLTNEEKELTRKDSSIFGIVADHRMYPQQDELIKGSQEASGVDAVFLETAETSESSADEDDNDHNDNGDNDSVSGRTYSDAETTQSVEKSPTPTTSEVDFSIGKEASVECGVNDSLCKSVRFVRKRREITRELNEDGGDDSHHHPHHNRDDTNRNVDDLNNEGRIYEQGENMANRERGYYYQHNHYRTSTSSSSRDSASGIVNKWENGMKAGSKPKQIRFSVESGIRGTNRIRKARAAAVSTKSSSSTTTLSLQDIDLSYNKISDLPRALLQMKSLKSLRLSGNQLKRDFVWEKLADWYMNSEDPSILKDGDDTFCGVVDDVRVFQFTVLGVLKAKKDLVETCRTVDKSICHECGLYSLSKQPGHGYNASHQSPHGNVAIALKLDCSYRNLSDFPEVPPQTWQLNVSGNFIKDLIPLKEPMYENLLILDADSNEINTLDGLTGTSFLDRYNYLSLQNNHFPVIPSNVLSSLKNMRGQGVTLLGANFVECDCDTVKDTKPLLLENSKKIKDLKEIFCKDMKSRTGESFMAVKDLQYTDLCYLDSEESNEMYLYLVIFIELLLIFVIVAKVWHDQRTFRRTGILPWCSAKMPRLPCDAMLESVKEPPHFNRSSSTNVRSYACEPPATQSISSCVQLRDVRSNSGQSEKSSQISQLSSFPGSSRTSSV